MLDPLKASITSSAEMSSNFFDQQFESILYQYDLHGSYFTMLPYYISHIIIEKIYSRQLKETAM